VAAPPTRPALRERYDRRQEGVVRAAASVFARRGYEATSMADLTQATGLTVGGLYHYIGSKEALLVRICEQLLEPLLEQARELVAGAAGPEERLRLLLRAWLAHIEDHLDHMLVFQQERHALEREAHWQSVRRSRKQFERIVDAILCDLEAAGRLRLPDRGLALHAILGMVNYTPQWFRPRGRLSAAEIADGYCELLLRG
jgi:AcrR family transcriptional regulator